MATFSKNDTQAMALALKLAEKGRFEVGANPVVGCVIARDGQIIARGFHQTFGQNHAEINALAELNFRAENAILYVTLEPCSHTGKTPPCALSIIQARPSKVIIATLDANPKVSGKGVAMLKAAGINVEIGLLETQAREINRGFIKRMTSGLPFVSLKIASSLDGKTALKSGESKWITGAAARADVQQLRAQNQAIITGSGTVLSDNPRLDVRDKNLPSPIKIVMDRRGQVQNKSLNIFKRERVIITDKSPINVLKMLGEMGINTVLIEAGANLSGAFLRANLVDELVIYQAPILLGSEARSMLAMSIDTLKNRVQLQILDSRMVGDDFKIRAKILDNIG